MRACLPALKSGSEPRCAVFLFGAFLFMRADPRRPPWLLLHDMCAMPAPDRSGVASWLSASGGSWSAVGPSGCVEGSVISTGYPHLMHTGSHCARTCFLHLAYAGVERRLSGIDPAPYLGDHFER